MLLKYSLSVLSGFIYISLNLLAIFVMPKFRVKVPLRIMLNTLNYNVPYQCGGISRLADESDFSFCHDIYGIVESLKIKWQH